MSWHCDLHLTRLGDARGVNIQQCSQTAKQPDSLKQSIQLVWCRAFAVSVLKWKIMIILIILRKGARHWPGA